MRVCACVVGCAVFSTAAMVSRGSAHCYSLFYNAVCFHVIVKKAIQAATVDHQGEGDPLSLARLLQQRLLWQQTTPSDPWGLIMLADEQQQQQNAETEAAYDATIHGSGHENDSTSTDSDIPPLIRWPPRDGDDNNDYDDTDDDDDDDAAVTAVD